MGEINQYRVAWVGPAGANGVSTFYSQGSVAAFLPRLKTFYEAIKGAIPTSWTIKFPAVGNIVEDSNGLIVANWAVTAPADTIGGGSGTWSAPVGSVINWKTSAFVNGRNLRGKTFVVPCVAACYDSSGRLTTLQQGIQQTAAINLAGGTDPLVIYSPSFHTSRVVSTATVPTLPAVLRSRRDQ